MKIYIGTDHRGLEIEKKIKDYLLSQNYDVISTELEHNDADDYPDFAFELASNVVNNPGSFGILICRTGIGMSIAANKVKGIRAACCHNTLDAYLTRNDNNANVLCVGYETPIDEIYKIIDTFINTKEFDHERHMRRVNKIIAYENGDYVAPNN